MIVEPVDLSDEEKNDLSAKIANANKILTQKVPLFGFSHIKDMRKEYLSKANHRRGNLLKFDQETRISLNFLIGCQTTILAAYGKLAKTLSDSFYFSSRADRPHLDQCDFDQEAMWALSDCIYFYDGSTQLSTYAYASIKRRLSNFVRTEEIHSGIGRPTRKIRRLVRATMRDKFCSFDKAMKILRETQEISSEMEEMVKQSCYNVKCVDWSDPKTHHAHHLKSLSEDEELLLAAIKRANLTQIQHELIDGFLKTGSRPDMDFVRNRINPNTNEPYTRQALSQQWGKACARIRELMDAA